MGTYLYYKLADDSDSHIKAINEFIQSLPAHTQLGEINQQIKQSRDYGIQNISFFVDDIYPGKAAGSIKMNPIPSEWQTEVHELYVQIFEQLHDHDKCEVKILSNSCAITPDIFNPSQLQRLTKQGEALSGDKKHEYRMTLQKCRDINAYPSEFFRTFQNQDLIGDHLEAIESIDLTQAEQTELEELFSDSAKLRILDLLLTFHNDSVTISRLAANTPLNKDEIKSHLTDLQQQGITQYKLAYIPDDYDLYEELVTIHNQTYNKDSKVIIK
jgi:hypothetical protein